VHLPLARLLSRPETAPALTPHDWDLLIRQARASNVLARVAAVLEGASLLGQVDPAPRAHLIAAATIGRQQWTSAAAEVSAVELALRSTGTAPILLKGAAYQAAGLDAARGRLFSDIDILVPQAKLGDVESALIRNGWQSTHHDAYTQRYYREWMHELPPMRHLKRDTTLDVHHTILPPTAGRKLDAAALIGRAIPCAGVPGVRVLAPADMVLHSMTHLFYDGELEHGFRDLVDLDSLLRQFAERSGQFWPSLLPRARELDLERPLYYGLRYVGAFMGTSIPPEVLAQVAGPGRVMAAWMDSLFERALGPDHPTCADAWTPLARWLLYVRAHWLRMPPHLLVYHLSRKALTRPPDAPTDTAELGR